MSTARIHKSTGFTLLEVMLAVVILGLVAISIYRFVRTTLLAVSASTDHVRETELMEGFAAYMRSQMQSFPQERMGVISGDPHIFSDLSQDELRWITGPGPGLLTRNATGDWTVTLTTRKGDLVMYRQDIEAKKDRTWISLITGIDGFEVRYFNLQTMQWQDKWDDVAARPALVRVKVWKAHSGAPYEVVLPLPPVPPGSHVPNFNTPPQPGAPGIVPAPVNGAPANGQTTTNPRP